MSEDEFNVSTFVSLLGLSTFNSYCIFLRPRLVDSIYFGPILNRCCKWVHCS